ncbi:MAG: hypothetical protein J7M29_01780 [Verrucomicrobia bacterium]|nr:hypothetical protein [Verrucomicrobiota bacterium]
MRAGALQRQTQFLLLAALAAGMGYFGGLRPLKERIRSDQATVTNLWFRLSASNRALALPGGLTPENFQEQSALWEKRLAACRAAEKEIRDRLRIPEPVARRLRKPFFLIDFQTERQALAESLAAFAKKQGQAFSPGATNGLPVFTGEESDPRRLWLRLFFSEQLLRAAAWAKVGAVQTLQQLPAIESAAPFGRAAVELPMYLETRGDFDRLLDLIHALPRSGAALGESAGAAGLTNKPALFLRRLFVAKSSPTNPGEVRAQLTVSGIFLPKSRPGKEARVR